MSYATDVLEEQLKEEQEGLNILENEHVDVLTQQLIYNNRITDLKNSIKVINDTLNK